VSPMGHAHNELKNLQQWQEYLLALHPTEIDMGLDRIRTVYERLDTESPALKIVIGGTNGKGSTAAILESILLTSGYRVGVYSSPHLAAVEAQRGETSLTFFEHTTLAAFHLFAQKDLDVWILEVGLGGRLDAVNLIDSDCAVLTQVDLDHQEYLSGDREQIGFEKA